jgi:hypothetical protein
MNVYIHTNVNMEISEQDFFPQFLKEQRAAAIRSSTNARPRSDQTVRVSRMSAIGFNDDV